MVETVGGRAVSDEQVQAWADEAERGYEPAQLRKRGRPLIGSAPGEVVPVRLDPVLLAAVAQRAEQDHLSRSEVIRAALSAWLDGSARGAGRVS